MAQTISSVQPGSIARQLGIQPGDRLLRINGEPVFDLIDYQALSSVAHIELLVGQADGPILFSFDKDEYEPLGLGFDQPLMSCIRNCCNRCVFCFVDQLPVGTRETMHVKDDDWRTSLMMGSYVTMTNVGERELARIIARHASPLYISVHATDDELRCQMLGTVRGAGILGQLRALAEGSIQFHSQAVLCPGLNDGAALDRTIADLVRLHPAALSLALVPVGLTGHREGLASIQPYDAQGARAVLELCEAWQAVLLSEIGTRFVFAADELYLLAGCDFPPDEAYEGYPQIDNGVGLCRLLETEYEGALADAEPSRAKPGRVAIACGTSVAPFMDSLVCGHPLPGIEVSVHPVENRFFGPSVTVSGLVTGSDLVRAMAGVEADRILITECMLRDGEDMFLDDITRAEAERALGIPIIAVGRTGEALLCAIAGAEVL